MSKKTLISFLGTGRRQKNIAKRVYEKVNYTYEEKEYPSSFVAVALHEHLNFDKIIIVGTAKSMWEEVYRVFGTQKGKFNDAYRKEIGDKCLVANHETSIDSIDLSKIENDTDGFIVPVLIPYGLNRKEHLVIFQKIKDILKELEENETLYLDITHAFRSLPLFATSAINYVNEVLDKNLEIKVTYGILEAGGLVEQGEEKVFKAPIVDLSIIPEIAEWNKAAHSFKDYGKGYLLADLLENENKDLAKKIRHFSDVVGINYLSDIKAGLTNLQKIYKDENFVKNEFAKLVVPDVIENFVRFLDKKGRGNNAAFQFYLSVWHRKQKNYAAAYIVFVESIVTYVCERKGKVWASYDDREWAKDMIKVENIFKLRNGIYSKANKIRNTIAHSKDARGNKTAADIQLLKTLQNKFENEYL